MHIYIYIYMYITMKAVIYIGTFCVLICFWLHYNSFTSESQDVILNWPLTCLVLFVFLYMC